VIKAGNREEGREANARADAGPSTRFGAFHAPDLARDDSLFLLLRMTSREVPAGAKARLIFGVFGTTKVVPFHDGFKLTRYRLEENSWRGDIIWHATERERAVRAVF